MLQNEEDAAVGSEPKGSIRKGKAPSGFFGRRGMRSGTDTKKGNLSEVNEDVQFPCFCSIVMYFL